MTTIDTERESSLAVGRRLALILAQPEGPETEQAIREGMDRLILSQGETAGDAFVLATWAGALLREICTWSPEMTAPDGRDALQVLRIAAALTLKAGTALERETGLSAASFSGVAEFNQ